jgi:hypothetical protein
MDHFAVALDLEKADARTFMKPAAMRLTSSTLQWSDNAWDRASSGARTSDQSRPG